jgi:hypothetical protein
MSDQDWLLRVSAAYKVYSEDTGSQIQIELFIRWLYQQYGIKYEERK